MAIFHCTLHLHRGRSPRRHAPRDDGEGLYSSWWRLSGSLFSCFLAAYNSYKYRNYFADYQIFKQLFLALSLTFFVSLFASFCLVFTSPRSLVRSLVFAHLEPFSATFAALRECRETQSPTLNFALIRMRSYQ